MTVHIQFTHRGEIIQQGIQFAFLELKRAGIFERLQNCVN